MFGKSDSRVSTVDHLKKLACFVKDEKLFCISKQVHLLLGKLFVYYCKHSLLNKMKYIAKCQYSRPPQKASLFCKRWKIIYVFQHKLTYC